MIVKRLEEQVKKHPEKLAVKTETCALTYRKLDEKATIVAGHILRICAEAKLSGDKIALLFEHGTDMIVGTIAALKAGMIYVPCDPSYPQKRLLAMLEDSEAALLVTNSRNLELAEQLVQENPTSVQVLNLDALADTPAVAVDVSKTERADDVAYLLYTSGSTGRPKGVMQTQTNVCYFIDGYLNMLKITEAERLTLFSTFGHDAAVMDIYGGLLSGATLYPLNIKENLNPARLVEWLREEKITVWHSVPTLYRRFMSTLQETEEFPDLRLIVLGGEGIREHDVTICKERLPHATLVNLYGQSESSFNSAQLLTPETQLEKIVLGQPLPATKLLLIDEQGKKVAPLRIGEIVVACEHIALGYWKNEEQTKKVFSSHPKMGRLYFTGDLGRLLLDGNIEFVGRKDFQVKIRGYRVETGEVESQLLKHPAVKETVVVGRLDKDGEMCLTAYYVPAGEVTDQELRQFLAKELPDHMVPSYWLALESIPMTATGKVDRGALPDVTTMVRSTVEYVAPQNETEATLVAIWQEILGAETVGIDDDFFSLGGHSLKATTLVARIYKELQVELMLGEIFQYTTIRQLSERIAQADKSIYESLKPTEEKKHYEVSSAQRRMFILNQLEDAGVSYNMPKALLVEGRFDRARFEETLQKLMQRQEILRTSYRIVEGQVIQIIHPAPALPVTYRDAADGEVLGILQELTQPFNLDQAPLWRAGLIRLAEEKHVLFFDMHHIISDGVSMGILIREFVSLYAGEELEPLSIQYKDFAAWQNELFATGTIEKQEQYWMEAFAGEIPLLNLPTDYSRPAMQSFEGDQLRFTLDRELAGKINALARRTGSTLYMVLLAAYNVLLAKYTGQDDIVVGSPIAGRPHADLQNIIGIFVNSLAMRNRPAAQKRFSEFLAEVKTNSLKAYENQYYQFEQLVERLQVKRQMNRNPLFDTMLILQNMENDAASIADLHFSTYEKPHTVSKLDLTLNAMEVGDEIRIEVEYCTRLFKAETIRRLMGHYLQILHTVAVQPEQKISELELLLPAEKEQILREFNATALAYPAEKTIHVLFEEQVQRTPEAVALVYADIPLTYQEFNNRANQLARKLREQGVKQDSIVAVVTKRSHEMMLGIMAVLKAGGAYLPLDPDYPLDRIKYILDDSKAEMVLTQTKLIQEGGLRVDCPTLCIDTEDVYQGESGDLESVSGPTNLAYIIYTSGSTGKPKGVMIEHQAVVNFIQGITSKIPFVAGKSILALTTISFDIFGLETLLPLTQGLRVVVGNDEHQRDTKALAMVIRQNGVEMLQMTPSRMRMLLNDEESAKCLEQVEQIMVGGEALPADLLQEIKGFTGARIYNMYGPTEATIWVMVKDLTDAEQITIGRPIANNAVYIVGPQNQLQPVGVPGELCIVGAGLARGYWMKPELTAERFVPNPFHSLELPMSGERMYRTGDLARWLPDGEIEFLGRTDEQVKVRGFRIELGEIESQLLKVPTVKTAVAVARDDNSGGKYLCAYVVLQDAVGSTAAVPGEPGAGESKAAAHGEPGTSEREVAAAAPEEPGKAMEKVAELKAHLTKELPDYMIPTYIIPLGEMPYTPNGKIDRKALPAPDAGMVSGVEYLAPATEIEAKILKIWEEVLGIEGIGVKHSFFDIGGNSINIIKVISLISKRMGVQVSMSELFLYPTAEEIAHNLFIENPLKGLDHVVRLNKPAEGKKNVFIIHTWEGIIYQYKELAKFLEGDYNVFGIQARGVVRPAILPETLREMVTDYIVEIKSIQPEGPYIIAGYCYGNWIAYRMVEMLEEQDVPIDRVVQIDENAWMQPKFRRLYRTNTIITWPYRFTRRWVRKLITRRKKNPMDFWPSLEEHKKSRPVVEGEVKNERTVRENVNHLCTAGYDVKHIISANVYVIKAEENNLVRYTPADWKKQTYGKVWFTEIPGGHESIFANPYVEELAKAFRRALEE